MKKDVKNDNIILLNIINRGSVNIFCGRGRPNFSSGFSFGSKTGIKFSFGVVSVSAGRTDPIAVTGFGPELPKLTLC